MARKRTSRAREMASVPPAIDPLVSGNGETTGRMIVVFQDSVASNQANATKALKSLAGCQSVASSADFAEGAIAMEQVGQSDAIYLKSIGVAIVPHDGDAATNLMAAAADQSAGILAVEPETMMY